MHSLDFLNLWQATTKLWRFKLFSKLIQGCYSALIMSFCQFYLKKYKLSKLNAFAETNILFWGEKTFDCVKYIINITKSPRHKFRWALCKLHLSLLFGWEFACPFQNKTRPLHFPLSTNLINRSARGEWILLGNQLSLIAFDTPVQWHLMIRSAHFFSPNGVWEYKMAQ